MPRLASTVMLVLLGCTGATEPVNAYPDVHWPSIHRGPKNSDFLDVQGVRSVEPAFTVNLGTVAAVLTVGPTGRVLVTTSSADDCQLYALDADSGEVVWCSADVGSEIISSSALSDVDGNIYVADDDHMWSLDVDGAVRWSTPIAAAPQSAQFLQDGSLFFVSRNAVAYVLDRESGQAVLDPVEIISGVPAGEQMGCLIGGADSGCPVANTPAVDHEAGRIYLTLTRPGEATGALLALAYDPEVPALTTAWESRVLNGGGGASPAVDTTGERLYVTDGTGRLLAMDTADGAVIWELPIGDAPLGSPAVTPDRRIFPGPLGPLLAVDDLGDSGSVAWEVPDAGAYGVVAVAGDVAYAGGGNALTLFDVADGTILHTVAGPNVSIGTSVDSDGHVLTASFTTVFGYRP